MDDLIDRLSEVRPRPSRDVDLTQVRQRVRQRRRRRRAAIGALGAVVVLAGVLGAGRLVTDGGDVELEVVGPVTSPVPVDPAAIGPEREVASGPMPDGGSWAFVAYETADGLCGRIETPAGAVSSGTASASTGAMKRTRFSIHEVIIAELASPPVRTMQSTAPETTVAISPIPFAA